MNQKLLSTLSQYKKIILVGGWTGWHIQPIISIVKNLKNTDIDCIWIGWIHSEEEKVANTEKIHFLSIPTLKLSTTRSFKILLYPFFLFIGFFRARTLLKWFKKWDDTAIFSKGWPGSIPIGIAAWSLSIPLYIHESDTIPGRSNRILGKFANKIWLWFESAKQYFASQKSEVIGQILDPVFSIQSTNLPTYEPTINWKTSKPHILVICGSQGAKNVFDAIIDQFRDNESYEWIIALWKLNSSMQSEFWVLDNCQAIPWISQENIAHLIWNTDIAISRWSATTLAELTSNKEKIPKLIIIPLPYSAGNHQYYNAKEYEKMGHILLEQKSIKELKNTIYNLQ